MATTPISALPAIPYKDDIQFLQHSATGNISEGDWLVYSGQYVRATNQGHTAYWKSSGAGIAMQANPTYDPAGRSVENSALLYANQGVFHVSASFSGQPALGLGAYPDATGSAVGSVTGQTGVGATWNTGVVLYNSALSGTANAQALPVATVIGSRNFSNAGTGELIIRLAPLNADVRG